MAAGINPTTSTMKKLLLQTLADKYSFLKNLRIDKWVPGYYFGCIKNCQYQMINK
jgi:hypothetical protein